MPSYKRFSDNSTNSTSSYKRFNLNEEDKEHVPSHHDLQKEREQFNVQQKMQPPPEPRSLNQMPTLNQQPSQSQMIKIKQDEMRRERILQEQFEQEDKEETSPQLNELSLDKLREMLPDSHEAHVRETFRLLHNENTLSIEQATNLAQGNGCFMDGPNEMCPSIPRSKPRPRQVENFKQKGDCSGENCNIKFNRQKHRENFKQGGDVVNKIKQLGQITFYSSSGCGFCNQSKQLFENAGLIGDGIGDKYIKVLENKPLPQGIRGYPHFSRGSKSHTGFPRSLDRFYELMK
jgi:hypothetical protein